MSDEREMGGLPQHGGYKNDEEEGPDVEAHAGANPQHGGYKNDEEEGPDVEAHGFPNYKNDAP